MQLLASWLWLLWVLLLLGWPWLRHRRLTVRYRSTSTVTLVVSVIHIIDTCAWLKSHSIFTCCLLLWFSSFDVLFSCKFNCRWTTKLALYVVEVNHVVILFLTPVAVHVALSHSNLCPFLIRLHQKLKLIWRPNLRPFTWRPKHRSLTSKPFFCLTSTSAT